VQTLGSSGFPVWTMTRCSIGPSGGVARPGVRARRGPALKAGAASGVEKE
jgi:hypothetical protein